MNILACDTTTKSLSVAILQDEEILFSHTENTGSTHSQVLMPLILRALDTAGRTFADIDLYSCTAGPGSYTGIRIGTATIKALAYAAAKPAVGVSTLNTLAWPFSDGDDLACPLIDARNRRVFAAAYRNGIQLVREDNYSAEDLLTAVRDAACREAESGNPVRRIVFCGDAATKFRDDPKAAEAVAGIRALFPGLEALFTDTAPQAADAARIAAVEAAEGGQTDPFFLEARYISPSQAERMKSGRKSAPAICVRPAELRDLDGICQLERECFATPWSEASLRKDLSENEFAHYFVAEAEGRVAGYIGVYMSFEDAQITNLAVMSPMRGRGIGRRLVREAVQFCVSRGCERMTLEVRTGNSGAIALYTSENFKPVGIRKGYYEDNGEDAIIMLKNLV